MIHHTTDIRVKNLGNRDFCCWLEHSTRWETLSLFALNSCSILFYVLGTSRPIMLLVRSSIESWETSSLIALKSCLLFYFARRPVSEYHVNEYYDNDDANFMPLNNNITYYQFSVSVKPFHFFHQISLSRGLSSNSASASLNIQRLTL